MPTSDSSVSFLWFENEISQIPIFSKKAMVNIFGVFGVGEYQKGIEKPVRVNSINSGGSVTSKLLFNVFNVFVIFLFISFFIPCFFECLLKVDLN